LLFSLLCVSKAVEENQEESSKFSEFEKWFSTVFSRIFDHVLQTRWENQEKSEKILKGRKFCTDSEKKTFPAQSSLTATFCTKGHFLSFQPFDIFPILSARLWYFCRFFCENV
jgi:hypothetical protein